MGMDSAKASVVSDGRLVVTPALSVCISWGVLTDPHRRGIVQIWQRVRSMFGDRLRWYFTECMRYKEPVDEEVLEMIPTWFEEGAPTRRRYLFYSHGGDHADAISPWCFELHIENTAEVGEKEKALLSAIYGTPQNEIGQQVNSLRISIPINDVISASNQVLELTKCICETMPLLYGYSGYSLLFDMRIDDLYPEVWSDVVRIAMRYPGYDVFDYDAIKSICSDKLRAINWVTVLGPEIVKEFVQSERRVLLRSKSIRVEPIQDNLIIVAGAVPQVGDRNKGDVLPLYREVWQALKPFLCEHQKAFSRVFDEEKTASWILRFESNE